MNEDHPESLLAFAWHFAAETSAVDASLVALNNDGFDLSIELGDGGERTIFIPFAPPLKSESEIRPRMIAMHEEALSARLR